MSKTFDQGREEIARLCRYFADNRQAFLAPGVKEAHVRQSLIDPFFEALGWDMRNTVRVAPQYREVITEDSLEIEGQQKAPDYTFRVGTLAKFYTEAKKCGININADPGPAYQLRRYGWSAKVPLSILTDFEELGVYDCSLRPRPTDKASFGRIQYFRNEEYPDRWRELWDIFSREAVWAGAYDRYAASKRKRGTSEVDSEFLKEIEGWRDSLARNIALRNLYLGYDDLNTAVQRTIDRLIFLRMAEDRGSESYGQLLKLCEQPEIYAQFMKLCRKADEKYNSGIFHFQKEEGVSEQHDRLTPALTIDDKVIKPILQSLYFEHGSPYHFGVLPVEILGTVYERFLGKVIRLTPEHRAKVEEKPEVRKAGGVYYTPSYIVDYIVKNTVGKMIEGKSPAQLGGGKNSQPLRVLDMACGSGSFLLGAYQCLLDHCLKWYLENHPEKHKEAVYLDSRGMYWRLTINEKKRILITHIFGVDIDLQAVEVSKLSLLLKVLEGETDETVGQSRQLFHERALPNLTNNIKCGNSLIGPDYFSGRLIPDPDEMKRVNPFDWQREFPDAMKSGGFDCVIGNPPYIRIQALREWAPLEVEAFRQIYDSASAGNYDIYVVFVEKGLNLLNAAGKLGFILPNKFFNTQYGEPLRTILSKGKHLAQIVHFGDQQVFAGVTTYTCLLFLDKASINECLFSKVNDLISWRANQTFAVSKDLEDLKPASTEGTISAANINTAEWNFAVGKDATLLERLSRLPVRLKDIASRIFQGIIPGADKVYTVELIAIESRKAKCYSRALQDEIYLEPSLLRKIVSGAQVGRYTMMDTNTRVIYPYTNQGEDTILISSAILKKEYPLTFDYFQQTRELLNSRDRGSAKGDQWYQYIRRQNISLQIFPKLGVPRLINRLHAGYDCDGSFCLDNVDVGGVILSEDCQLSYQYVLGLLNSKLLNFFFIRNTVLFRGGYYSANRQFIENLPIYLIDFSNHVDVDQYNQIITLVKQMIELCKRQSTVSKQNPSLYQRQIDATDREIDRLIYELYGLTEDEIKIVEN